MDVDDPHVHRGAVMKKDVLVKGGLTVLPHYVERRFNKWKTTGVRGACLLMQLGAVYHNTLGVGNKAIQRELKDRCGDLPYSDAGWSLPNTMPVFEHLSPWKITGVIEHDVQSSVSALKRGVPLLFVHDRSLISENECSWDGIARLNPWRDRLSMDTGYNHSLLVIGVDKGQQCLIARESRPRYASCGGMLKMNITDLQRWRAGWRLFELVFEKNG